MLAEPGGVRPAFAAAEIRELQPCCGAYELCCYGSPYGPYAYGLNAYRLRTVEARRELEARFDSDTDRISNICRVQLVQQQ